MSKTKVNERLRFVFTKEDRKTARRSIEKFRSSYIIDAREIILQSEYAYSDIVSTASDYIINKEIEKKLTQAINNKKSQQIIYFHHELTPAVVKNIKKFFRSNKANMVFCVYDPTKTFKRFWHLFDEVQQ